MKNTEQLLSLCKEEYGKLKDEQLKRIGIRENLIYVTLASFGAIVSFYFSTEPLSEILLVFPWVSVALAAVYIRNDQKITAIGKYLQEQLIPQIESVIRVSGEEPALKSVFSWETYRTTTKGRLARKLYQLFINFLVFVLPSVVALILFMNQVASFSTSLVFLIVVEILMILVITIQFLKHTDLGQTFLPADNTELKSSEVSTEQSEEVNEN